MPTNPLSHAQLAEGARLLAEFKSDPTPRTFSAWAIWRTENGEALMLRVAEVEWCVREAIEKMRAYREQYTEDAKSQTGDEKEYSLTMAGAFIQAACGIIDIAAEHNIDLSEPTPAGEPTKGST